MTDWADEKAVEIAHEVEWDSPLGAHHYGVIAQALRDERSRCAKIAEDYRVSIGAGLTLPSPDCNGIAAAILDTSHSERVEDG